MIKRRDILAFAPALPFVSIAAPLLDSAKADASDGSILETRLFNFKDEIDAKTADDIVADLKDAAREAGASGFLSGRNFIPDPFSTRFEWIFMSQFEQAGTLNGDPAFLRFRALRERLSGYCRNQAECDLIGPLPVGFANANGVKVRHTVMFDFKEDASREAQLRIVDAIRRMGTLPMVKSYRVQQSPKTSSGDQTMQWQVIGDFGSVEDYSAYSKAPVPLSIRQDFTAETSRVAFLDVAL